MAKKRDRPKKRGRRRRIDHTARMGIGDIIKRRKKSRQLTAATFDHAKRTHETQKHRSAALRVATQIEAMTEGIVKLAASKGQDP
ncbi:MAG: hypothetical protein JXB14_05935, partial [Candidatus Altiarchaeota archaeon]|nr:hypothetical protein [Candidatus Altiarchaeota archaeon]